MLKNAKMLWISYFDMQQSCLSWNSTSYSSYAQQGPQWHLPTWNNYFIIVTLKVYIARMIGFLHFFYVMLFQVSTSNHLTIEVVCSVVEQIPSCLLPNLHNVCKKLRAWCYQINCSQGKLLNLTQYLFINFAKMECRNLSISSQSTFVFFFNFDPSIVMVLSRFVLNTTTIKCMTKMGFRKPISCICSKLIYIWKLLNGHLLQTKGPRPRLWWDDIKCFKFSE